ncbi:MAG: hypothetical protein GY807_06470 [Gammaproteobacteria bacterium]|nr:hypothetical protein [Gammaproteobacteria bacterium]
MMASVDVSANATPPRKTRMNYLFARTIVISVWLFFSLVIFGTILLQDLNSRFSGDEYLVWNWAIALLGPNLGLIVTFVVSEHYVKGTDRERYNIAIFRFFVVLGFNLIYLLSISGLIIFEPFYQKSFLVVMDESSVWLAPLATVVTSSVALFFVTSKEER